MKLFYISLSCIIILLSYACTNDNSPKDTTDTNNISTPITIFVANFGNLDRSELAEKIEVLQKFSPKAIGFDAVFSDMKENDKDEKLKNAFALRNNIVLGAFGEYDNYGEAHGIKISNEYFGKIPYGYCELVIDDKKEAESIDKQINLKDGRTIYPLSVEIVRMYNPDAFEYYKNHTGRAYKFKYAEDASNENINVEEIDFEEITDTSSSLNRIKDGIVLLGYLGTDQISRQVNDSIDNFTYTDHSGRHIVKGVKIHAYIIGKILNEYRLGK